MKSNPTYRSMGDHAECIQVDFDPSIVGYADLLNEFFVMHNATRLAHSDQYASLILYVGDMQAEAAAESVGRYAALLGAPVLTRIRPLDRFYPAEDYHQKYHWKHSPELLREFPLVDDYSLWAVARALGKPLPRFLEQVGEERGAGSCPV